MFSAHSLGKCLHTKDCNNWDVDTLKPVYYSPVYNRSACIFWWPENFLPFLVGLFCPQSSPIHSNHPVYNVRHAICFG